MTFAKTVYERILYFGRQSVTGRVFGAMGRGFDRMVSNSLIFSALGRESAYDCGEQSLLGRFLQKLWSIFPAIGKKGRGWKEKSTVASYLGDTVGQWRDLPLAWFGSFLLPLSILAYLALGVAGFAAVFLLGAVLMLFPCTLGGCLAGSRLIGFFCDVEAETVAVRRGIYWPPFLCGMVGAMLGAFFGLNIAVIFLALAVGGAVLLCHPLAGLLLMILGAPFLPTMALAGLLLITLFCYLIAQAGGANRGFAVDNTGVLVAAFGLMLIFFGLTSFVPLKSTQIAILECCFLLGYFLILWLVNSAKAVRAAVFCFCLAAFGCGLIGLYQYLSGDVNTTWTDTELFTSLQLRVYSTFGNPNVYGEFLLLAFPCAAVMCYIAAKPLMKVFYGGTALLLLVNLALTYSRGCYLALIFTFFLVVCWGARKLLVFVPLVLAAMPFVMPESIIDRFASIVNFDDTSTSYRMSIWLGTLNMLEHYLFLGIGLGQEAFTSVYSHYQMNQVFAPHAHNLFLQVTSEMGIGGLILLIGLFLAFFVGGYLAHRKVKGSKTSWFILVMMAAVGGYLMEGIFDNVWYNYRVFLIFFMVLGLVGTVSRLVIKENCAVFDGSDDAFGQSEQI